MGETMICGQDYAHDHRLPHLQRRWGTLLACLKGVDGYSIACSFTVYGHFGKIFRKKRSSDRYRKTELAL